MKTMQERRPVSREKLTVISSQQRVTNTMIFIVKYSGQHVFCRLLVASSFN
nr:hypothetical protein [Escherichia coli]